MNTYIRRYLSGSNEDKRQKTLVKRVSSQFKTLCDNLPFL